MGLAEQMLDTISVDEQTDTYLQKEEEPHIVINEDRVAIVPAALRVIAVTGDKDIETLTFDCVRYWEGNDLSTFSIYLNYVLPDQTTGTYIPDIISTNDGEKVFHFDWQIKNNITAKSGKISFAITAIKTKQNDEGETVIDKQWSSIPNTDCSIALGLDISNVPTEEESPDVIAQLSKILEDFQSDFSNWVETVVVQTGGNSKTKVMSQKAVSNTFANALKGKESGATVAMDDVSPIPHKIPVKTSSKNLFDIYDIAEELVRERPNGFAFVEFDGKQCLKCVNTVNALFYRSLQGLNAHGFRCSIYTKGYSANVMTLHYDNDTKEYIGTSDSNQWVEFSRYYADKVIDTISFYVDAEEGNEVYLDLDSVFVEESIIETEYEPYVADDTEITVKSCGKNLVDIRAIAEDLVSKRPEGFAIVEFDGRTCLKCVSSVDAYYYSLQGLNAHGFRCKLYAKDYSKSVMSLEYSNGTDGYIGTSISNQWVDFSRYYSDVTINTIAFYIETEEGNEVYLDLDSVFVETSATETEYEPYKEGETITTTIAEGAELNSIAPNMTIITDTQGVVINAEYNKDTNKVIEKLTQAIISLGGNI